jgi:phage terminase large subunit-like protein
MLRKPFMPHQQYVADVLGEIVPETGRLAYSEGGVTIPRQEGKSTFIEAKAAHRCSATGFFGGRQNVLYTAQTRQKARKKWEEGFLADLRASAAFRGRIDPSLANGNEHIRFPDGSSFGIEAVTEKAGHGDVVDEAYIDEAFAHQDWRLEQAFRPAMITRVNKLLMWISTAGWLGASPYLEAKVEAGRRAVAEGRRSGLAYFEWSAPQDADPGDESVWRACMPALGHTISIEAMRAEYAKAVDEGKLNEFRRAFLNQWVPKDVPDDWLVIPEAAWANLADPESHPVPRVVLSAVFAHDQSAASVGLAGWRADGLLHGEVADYRPGTSWAVPRLIDMNARHDPAGVVVDEAGHESVIIKDLEAAGVPVIRIGTRGVTQAYAGLIEDVLDSKRFRHRGQPDLDAAVAVAVTRDVGDGGKAWGRRKSAGDISPVVSVTNAAWGLRAGNSVPDPDIF